MSEKDPLDTVLRLIPTMYETVKNNGLRGMSILRDLDEELEIFIVVRRRLSSDE